MTIAWIYDAAPGVDAEKRAHEMQGTRPGLALMLMAIARGHHTVSDISKATRANRHLVSHHLGDLLTAGEIVKRVPASMSFDDVPWAEGFAPKGTIHSGGRGRARGREDKI